MRAAIDPMRFAKKGETRVGEMHEFPRLVGDVVSDAKIEYELSGAGDGHGEYWLTLSLTGMICVFCQRCLEPMAYPIDLMKRYRLVSELRLDDVLDDEALLDESTEILPVNQTIDLTELIEDELLLALPAAPKHEDCYFLGQDPSQIAEIRL